MHRRHTRDQVTIELARTSDAGRIAWMSREHIEHGLGWEWRPRRVWRAIHARDTMVIVARHPEEGVVGFAIMWFGTRRAHLSLFAVLPEWRRRGVGRRLLAWLEEAARCAGTFDVSLEVRDQNENAQAFYQALGYREVALVRGYYQGREHAVRMYRDLRARR